VRTAILPAKAMILARGKFQAFELEPGDLIQAYDYNARRPVMAAISTNTPVEPVKKILAPVLQFKIIPFSLVTKALTPQGEKSLADGARQFIGYCNSNPTKLLIRTIDALIEYDEMVDAVQLMWEWPQYIWVEGILVGIDA